MALTSIHVHLSGGGEARVIDLDVDLDPAAALTVITDAFGSSSPALERGGLRIDPDAREVSLHGREVCLTRREFDLLVYLAAHPRRVFSRAELLEKVWGSSEAWQVASTVTEHVRRIRQKLGESQLFIENVRGVGYRFVA